jgi:uncharacterized protein YcfL
MFKNKQRTTVIKLVLALILTSCGTIPTGDARKTRVINNGTTNLSVNVSNSAADLSDEHVIAPNDSDVFSKKNTLEDYDVYLYFHKNVERFSSRVLLEDGMTVICDDNKCSSSL